MSPISYGRVGDLTWILLCSSGKNTTVILMYLYFFHNNLKDRVIRGTTAAAEIMFEEILLYGGFSIGFSKCTRLCLSLHYSFTLTFNLH